MKKAINNWGRLKALGRKQISPALFHFRKPERAQIDGEGSNEDDGNGRSGPERVCEGAVVVELGGARVVGIVVIEKIISSLH